MKKLFLLFAYLFCATLFTWAQQQGVVRTLERPSKPSEGISGVTINVLEYPNAIVSKKGGKFSFTIEGKRAGDSFTISRVQKKGYSLVDKQLKGRRFAYSPSVPVEIVMVADAQLESDKKRIEDKAYNRAKKDYDQKVDILGKQLKEKTISEQEYRKKYEELNNNYNNYIQLIDQMAERYATTDFKGLSEVNREILECIENADLERADSLINTKGDFDQREQELNNKRALKEKSEQLSQQLEKDIEIELADLNQDFANKFYIHSAAYRNDSAAYYLERIVNLNPTSIGDIFHAASFIDSYLADYPRARKYYQMALDQINDNTDDEMQDVAGVICRRIGLTYDNQYESDKALEWHHKSLDLLTKMAKPDSSDVAMTYTLIGRAYTNKEEYDKGLEYTLKGLHMREQAAQPDTAELAQSYNNLAFLANHLNDNDKALEYHQKALDLRRQAFGENSQLAAFSHMNIGSFYYVSLHDKDKALEHLNKAYEVFHPQFGSAHPYTQQVLIYLGQIHLELGNYDQAVEYFREYAQGMQQYYGAESYEAARSIIYLANAYLQKGDSAHALEYYQQALDICEKLPDTPQESIDQLKGMIQTIKKNNNP